MTLYEILGLTALATAAEIKAAHRQAVKAHHPDVGGDAQKFEQVQRAYFILSDPDRRARYDSTGIEDDPSAASEEQLAQSIISSIILRFIGGTDDLSQVDIVLKIRETLRNQKNMHVDACSKIDSQINRVEIVRSRLSRKDDTDGALSTLLSQKERELNISKSRERSQVSTIERALNILDDYTYRTDPNPTEEAKIWFALKP